MATPPEKLAEALSVLEKRQSGGQREAGVQVAVDQRPDGFPGALAGLRSQRGYRQVGRGQEEAEQDGRGQAQGDQAGPGCPARR